MQWSGASGLSGETASPGCRLAALCVECAARMPRTWESAGGRPEARVHSLN